MGRYPRGRVGWYHRGKWRWGRRFPRKRAVRVRRRRFRLKSRRGRFTRYFKKRFFNPRPGSYIVRLRNPYNTLNLLFQGVIFINCAKQSLNDFSGQQKITYCRVAKIGFSLANLLRANWAMTKEGKLGGPSPCHYHDKVQGRTWNPNDNWPGGYYPSVDSGKEAAATPDDWWRWAIMLVSPADTNMCFKSPKPIYLEEMLEQLGGYQLFTHRVTKVKVLATDGMGSTFSPVASLMVQDEYFNRDRGSKRGQEGQLPYTGGICTQRAQGSAPQYFTQDEGVSPWMPPNVRKVDASTTYNTGETVTCEWMGDHPAIYSPEIYMSFATLTALGAPWSFPSNQKGISRGSFNKHTIRGVNDPQGQKWMTLVPKKVWWIDAEEDAEKTGIETIIGELYLAQGAIIGNSYKFGTYQQELPKDTLVNHTWAIIKVRSLWTLGNHRRPYNWDVNWWNTIGTMGS
uniref:Capsid protein n=1 Tax=Gyrovirus GyV9 TaxID=1682185 RepID=A0A0H4U5P0_9VIRU|nr:VP1 [Gyrovirus GyV9]